MKERKILSKKQALAKNKSEDGFDRLARLIKAEGTERRKDIENLGQLIKNESEDIRAEIHDHRAETRTGFERIDQEHRHIRSELLDIIRRLERLEEDADAMKGYAKEIVELRARVNDIEKHLGTTHVA